MRALAVWRLVLGVLMCAGCGAAVGDVEDLPNDALESGPDADLASTELSVLSASCVGQCGGRAPAGCWCDDQCEAYGNCCADYASACLGETCADSCGGRSQTGSCWCNDSCRSYGDCCDDYDAQCTASDPWPNLSGSALKSAVASAAADGHRPLGYTAARNKMYGITGNIDVHGGKIECIYTGRITYPDGTRAPGGFNTEHSWPKSDGASSYPRDSDLHHMFPTYGPANAQRASYNYGETVCSGYRCPYADGGSERGASASGQTVFQVRPEYRGDVARAHFYFSVRYNMGIGAAEEQVLRAWHAQDPVSAREAQRNDDVEAAQGNRNPFVDYPGVVSRISNF